MKYQATVERDDRWWLVQVPALGYSTQAESREDVEPMARDLIATVLDIDPEDIDVDVSYKP
ncbi:MAG TPA: hypothetical protein PLZ93_01160 [Nocardioides sp.]|uniref:hypothetical protein n=1 Tax=uncultured Nocardioides sp. TaxID=198441 RepID=UPI0026143F6A|nr:hypothetical protein [uncultured Nocardioides sp.]HRD60937.1 hypothetical protein [Nocardioides sp.]HRI94201.1 hypothetical protein [Nocardioides sp.]HRK44161.1 hypothetical protein [Nocardioides sp.]